MDSIANKIIDDLRYEYGYSFASQVATACVTAAEPVLQKAADYAETKEREQEERMAKYRAESEAKAKAEAA